jgi:5-methylcytosine-specific restriction endonuclease McrA
MSDNRQTMPWPNQPWTAGPCLICGTPFVSPCFAERTCSSDCQRKHVRNKDRLKAQRRRLAIYQRDHGRCQLCHKPVDLDETVVGRRATLDHIVPRSAGGANTTDNLQLAHEKCNTIKANHVGPKVTQAVKSGKPLKPQNLTHVRTAQE